MLKLYQSKINTAEFDNVLQISTLSFHKSQLKLSYSFRKTLEWCIDATGKNLAISCR